ncbi:MAG: transketolase [Candidatus Celaenobacter antarcticus]|nr:transketolase [Candidatus Celaenobacter antarcticus]
MERITEIDQLKRKAEEIRYDIVDMIAEAGSGHPGGSLSAADIGAVLFFNEMKYDPQNPEWKDRDKFILSKGHAAPLLYTLLAHAGYFERSELKTLRKYKSRLQGHPASYMLPGVEVSTGSLGQGLSISCGIAMAGKMDKKNYRVYTLLGDGELDEGQVWEAAMFATHKKLDNLCAIVDRNRLQIDGDTEQVMALEPLKAKWDAFGWHTILIDGHNISDILHAFEEFNTIRKKPTIILAKTVKGKGVSFMENIAGWHGKAPNKEELEQALKEIKARMHT